MHQPSCNVKSLSGGSWFIVVLAFLQQSSLSSAADLPEQPTRQVQILKTATGTRFGIWGDKPSRPAPTLFTFALSIEETLGSIKYRQSGSRLADEGFLVVSLDLPCHGRDHRPGEPAGLEGWRARIDRGIDVMALFVAQAAEVLDYLIANGYTDPKRVAACGTSRGGFAAMHFAAADPRVRCVAAFAPVTDLAALSEFQAIASSPLVERLALRKRAEKLAGRPVWIAIGDADARVDTDRAIALSRSISAAAHHKHLASQIELHVMPDCRGHATPLGASDQAAEWISDRVNTRRLFDGHSFASWEGNLKMFRIEDGAIVGGTLRRPIPNNEFLCTREAFEDFELRLCFKVLGPGVNAGVQFRSRRIPNHYEVIGYQADLADKYWGCLYDESRRGKILAQSPLDEVGYVLRQGDWNYYRIRCHGRRIQIWLNDLKTVNYVEPDKSIDRRGVIGLQIHSGGASEAWYKDIEIRPLSKPATPNAQHAS